MNKTARNITMAALLGLAAYVAVGQIAKPSEPQTLAEGLAIAAKRLNKEEPAKLHEWAVRTNTVAEGNTLTYSITMPLLPSSDLDTDSIMDLHNELKGMIVREACVDPVMMAGMRQGASYRYEFHTNDGSMVSGFAANKTACLQMGIR